MSSITFTPISIKVEDLWVVKGGGLFSRPKSLLQEVSLTIEAGQFIGVVGPNGAGKTTLFKALVGDKPARGRILFSLQTPAGPTPYESFYDNPEYWLQQIGYVPVDNILHDDLTIEQALLHVGRLRLPGVPDAEIMERVQAKLIELGFERDDERLHRFVKNLSSGERKKANIVAELLTNPPLLLLDEPTSNLDPNAERDLMDSLKKLAGSHNGGNGPTILLITHTLDTLDRCDHVIFIENSRLKAHGSMEHVFNSLEDELRSKQRPIPASPSQFEHWATIFEEFKTGDTANRDRVPPDQKAYTAPPTHPVTQDSTWRQFKILFSRYFLIRYNDLSGIIAILVAAFIAGFLLLIAPSEIFLETDDATGARQTVVLYVILLVIMGAFITHRDISKEFRIYMHERTKGLSPLAYIVSKTLWLSGVVGVLSTLIILALTGMPIARLLSLMSGVLLFLVGLWTTLRGNLSKRLSQTERYQRVIQFTLLSLPLICAAFVQLQYKALPNYPIDVVTVELVSTTTLMLTSIAALAMGLMVSSAVNGNNDRATQLAIGLIIVNVILAFSVLVIGNAEFQSLFDTLEPFAITHWGYRGFSSALSIYCWAGQPRFENYNSSGHIAMIWFLLITHIVVTTALSVVFLRFQETWTTPGRVFGQIVRERSVIIFALSVAVLLGWSTFLSQQSYRYYELTFFDRLYGGNRYADARNVSDATAFQTGLSDLSASACRLAPSIPSDEPVNDAS